MEMIIYSVLVGILALLTFLNELLHCMANTYPNPYLRVVVSSIFLIYVWATRSYF